LISIGAEITTLQNKNKPNLQPRIKPDQHFELQLRMTYEKSTKILVGKKY